MRSLHRFVTTIRAGDYVAVAPGAPMSWRRYPLPHPEKPTHSAYLKIEGVIETTT
jgi:hypothetical protein